MFKFKKVISMVLTLSLLFLATIPALAASDATSSGNSAIPKETITGAPIDVSKVQSVLNDYVSDGSVTQDYADKVMEIVNNYTANSTANSSSGKVTTDNYYNPSTGAIIMLLPTGINNGYQLMFNKAGWNIIKEVISIGGGSATIGFGIAALCGVVVTGPIAAIVGGIVVVSIAWVNLQFALGNEFATLPI